MTARIRTFINEYPNVALLLGSCLIGGMVISIWVIESWEYLPDWTSVPSSKSNEYRLVFAPLHLVYLRLTHSDSISNSFDC